MKLKNVGEIALIERISRGFKLSPRVVKGIGDDAAVLKCVGGRYLLYTCDMLIEDVHFKANNASPRRIGYKAMARNVSDIAAMGGIPRYALVSLGVDPDEKVEYVEGIYEGIKDVCRKFGVDLVGGDMSRSVNTVIDISLLGEVEPDRLVTRSGARRGDLIMVTGSFGGSIKGKHLDFTPRIKESRILVENYKLTSMIDTSDGLILDLSRIMRSSRVGARIHESLIPVSNDADSLDSALTDGEDFELLFTMAPLEAKRFFRTHLVKMKTPVTLIGEITDKSRGLVLVRESGVKERLNPEGYLHF